MLVESWPAVGSLIKYFSTQLMQCYVVLSLFLTVLTDAVKNENQTAEIINLI